MDAKLVVTGGNATHKKFRLKLPTVVGRDQNAGLVVSHPTVSRRHCEILDLNGGLVVRDTGSANGTFVGKTKVTEALLRPGDELTIGPLTFRAEYEPEVELTETASLDDLKAGLLKKRIPPVKVKKARPTTEEDAADTKPLDVGTLPTMRMATAADNADDELDFDLNLPPAAGELPPAAWSPDDDEAIKGSVSDEGTVTSTLAELGGQGGSSSAEFDPLAFLQSAGDAPNFEPVESAAAGDDSPSGTAPSDDDELNDFFKQLGVK